MIYPIILSFCHAAIRNILISHDVSCDVSSRDYVKRVNPAFMKR